MCRHHTPIKLLAERRAAADDEREDDAEDEAEVPTLTPPTDD